MSDDVHARRVRLHQLAALQRNTPFIVLGSLLVAAAQTGVLAGVVQSSRLLPWLALLGGSGMNRVIKMIMDGDKLINADIFYPPTLIAPAIEVTSMRYATQSPIRGRYVLDSPLITAENAAEFCFPGSPC